MFRLTAATILLSSMAVGQLFPPTMPPLAGDGFCCSWVSNAQQGDYNPDCGAPVCPEAQYLIDPGEMWLGGYCNGLYAQWSPSPIVGFAVAQGGSIFWQTAAQNDSRIFLTCAEFSPWFALSFYTGSNPSIAIPDGAAEWDQLFSSDAVLFQPSHLIFGWPNQEFESWVLEVPIPVAPSLAGTYIQCQSIRPDFFDGLIHASSAMVALIGS